MKSSCQCTSTNYLDSRGRNIDIESHPCSARVSVWPLHCFSCSFVSLTCSPTYNKQCGMFIWPIWSSSQWERSSGGWFERYEWAASSISRCTLLITVQTTPASGQLHNTWQPSEALQLHLSNALTHSISPTVSLPFTFHSTPLTPLFLADPVFWLHLPCTACFFSWLLTAGLTSLHFVPFGF